MAMQAVRGRPRPHGPTTAWPYRGRPRPPGPTTAWPSRGRPRPPGPITAWPSRGRTSRNDIKPSPLLSIIEYGFGKGLAAGRPAGAAWGRDVPQAVREGSVLLRGWILSFDLLVNASLSAPLQLPPMSPQEVLRAMGRDRWGWPHLVRSSPIAHESHPFASLPQTKKTVRKAKQGQASS